MKVFLIKTKTKQDYCNALSLCLSFNDIEQTRIALPIFFKTSIKKIEETIDFLGVAAEVINFSENKLFSSSLKIVHSSIFEIANEKKILRTFSGQDNSDLNNKPIVSVIGEEGLRQALSLGLLLNRQVVCFEDFNSFFNFYEEIDPKSYFMVLSNKLNLPSFERIVENSTKNIPIGFFYDKDPEVAEMFMLKTLLFSKNIDTKQRKSLFVYPLYDKDVRFESNDVVAYFGASKGLKEELINPFKLAFIDTHSNGINAYLGNQILCARESVNTDFNNLENIPACFSSNICNRTDDSNTRISIDKLKVKVLCLSACYASLLSTNLYDDKTQLVYQLANGSYVSSIIATYSSVLGGIEYGKELYNSIPNFETLSEAVNACSDLDSKVVDEQDNKRIFFGDPEFKLNIGKSLEESVSEMFNYLSYEECLRYMGLDQEKLKIKSNDYFIQKEITADYFNKLNFYRSIVSALREKKSNNSPAFTNSIDNLSRAIDSSWQLGVKVNQSVRKKQKLSTITVFQLQNGCYSSLHESWHQLLSTLVQTEPTGLRVKTILDDSSEMGVEDSALRKCCYCNSLSIRTRQYRYLAHINQSSKWEVCLNCGEIFDGFSCFQNAQIITKNEWGLKEENQLSIKFDYLIPGRVNYIVSFFVEPFQWQSKSAFQEIKKGITVIDSSEVNFNLNAVNLDDSWPAGLHYIGALVMFNENFVILRRPIRILV